MPFHNRNIQEVRMKKRLLSLLIAVITVISVTAVPAFAITQKEAEEKAARLIELIIYGEMYATQKSGGGTVKAMYPALVEAIKNDPALYDKLLGSYFENSDEYTTLLTPETINRNVYGAESVGLGFSFVPNEKATGLLIHTVVAGSPAETAGLHKGDTIVSIEGVDISKLPSNEAAEMLSSYSKQEGKTFTVGILHADGDREDVKITPAKYSIAAKNVTYGIRKSADGTEAGYIKIGSFLADTPAAYKAALDELEKKGVKNLVIDLRDNGGGDINVAYEMLNATIPASLPLYYRIEKNFIGPVTSDNATDFAPDIAVLINEETASAAELFTAVLQYNDVAAIVGDNSNGKASAQAVIKLSDGSYLAVTALTLKLPNGKSWEDTGVTPDIKAADDLKTEEIDEAFEAAVKVLDGKPATLKEPETFDFYLNCSADDTMFDVVNIVSAADPAYGKDVRFIFRSKNGVLLTMNAPEALFAYKTVWYTAFFDTAKYKAALTEAGYKDFEVLGTLQDDYGFDAKITLKTDVDAKYFYYWDAENGSYEAFDGKPSYKDGTLTFTTRYGGLIIVSETKIK
jgi:C-terminal peptidase prc